MGNQLAIFYKAGAVAGRHALAAVLRHIMLLITLPASFPFTCIGEFFPFACIYKPFTVMPLLLRCISKLWKAMRALSFPVCR